ncbi:phage head-tail connector protein [Anaerocaecibacter muris]|uniref:phage head-tail connector protein n=1 Tax=Anaerocaecibacter muris TaxID=2941513 RepID=UPI002040FAD1|nr:phage head-tail connector protein [Anaerocaecibacter muris]MCX4312850.1 phage head-tail connector protein [Clostridia bacterium]
MTDNEKLELLKNMYDGDESDAVLSTYLALAADKILNRLYPFDTSKTEIPDRYIRTQISIACYLLGKRGAEGETAHKENGIDRTYASADVPEDMLKDIIPFCGVM